MLEAGITYDSSFAKMCFKHLFSQGEIKDDPSISRKEIWLQLTPDRDTDPFGILCIKRLQDYRNQLTGDIKNYLRKWY